MMSVLCQTWSLLLTAWSWANEVIQLQTLTRNTPTTLYLQELDSSTFLKQHTYTQTPSTPVNPWKLVKSDLWSPNGRKSIECSCIGSSWVVGPDGGIVHTECWAKQCASLMYSATETPFSSDKHTDKWIFSIVAIHNGSVVRTLIHCSKEPFITWGAEAYCVWQVCNASC